MSSIKIATFYWSKTNHSSEPKSFVKPSIADNSPCNHRHCDQNHLVWHQELPGAVRQVPHRPTNDNNIFSVDDHFQSVVNKWNKNSVRKLVTNSKKSKKSSCYKQKTRLVETSFPNVVNFSGLALFGSFLWESLTYIVGCRGVVQLVGLVPGPL